MAAANSSPAPACGDASSISNTTTTAKKELPPWTPPSKEGKLLTGLMVNNSLTGSKVEFVPMEGRKVKWYYCGPTVYDAAHLGHARTYLCFDVMRRIMADYFGYELQVVMNITDIDDKIIKRSAEVGRPFASFARDWETSFFEDMRRLNVMLPDVITRVSEFVPEVVEFIQEIIGKGYAYESNGSVYFDSKRFQESGKHFYGRMEPNSVQDQSRVLEGEGELGVAAVESEKKSAIDFALWKKAKVDEPSWPSPWGDGRPGWHIECSVMATHMLGFPMDVHAGGIDLRFPHHDNEIAQCEACYDRTQWTNYFLHSGHLHISGRKMSKTLKNFITIEGCLERHPGRLLRLLTLMHQWDSGMSFDASSTEGSSSSFDQAASVDRNFMNFFATAKGIIRSARLNDRKQRWGPAELKLNEKLDSVTANVHRALQDNFNTPLVLTELQALITAANSYLNETPDDLRILPLFVKAARFAFRILRTFGMTNGSEESLNYLEASDGGSVGNDDAFDEAVDSLLQFRQSVRAAAYDLVHDYPENDEGGDDTFEYTASCPDRGKALLRLCDNLRDEDMVNLGVQLEDGGNSVAATWKKIPREVLLKEREEKELEKKRKEEQKALARQAECERKEKKDKEARVAPVDYYKTFQSDQFATFDESGIPLTKVDGEAVSKSQREKMRKFLEKHSQIHQKFKAAA